MKKFKSVACFAVAVIATAFALPVSACGHEHKWEWRRTLTEHWQECTVSGCGEERFRANHNDGLCGDCAEFKALAFGFVEGGDSAHSDFAKEATEFFTAKGKELGFIYEHTTDWSKLNDDNLANYNLVLFLNDRPSDPAQQQAFKKFMDGGGAWLGFHSAAFSMVDYSKYESREQDPGYWKWYQDKFLCCGDYARNTWNPTSEPLKVETYDHCATRDLELEDDTFISAPCEWYGWEYDLTENADITVLVTLNPTAENPAGDQPDPKKPYEIWYEGSYPIAWSNNNYKMIYMNWGHNLQSYNTGKEGKSSKTFDCEQQAKFVLDAMFGLTK